MATPAERKALLFFALVATLGAGVRLWRARHADSQRVTMSADTGGYDDSSQSSYRSGTRKSKKKRTTTARDRSSSASHTRGSRSGSRTGQIVRDLSTTVDLDRASMSEIDALGVLQPGTARMIVEDRESFGPFGSIEELERVPFLSTTVIRKLAPRVTFSRLPRPRNTIIQPRMRAGDVVVPRRVRRGKGSAQ